MNKANMKNWSTEEVTILVWICCRYSMLKSRELSALVKYINTKKSYKKNLFLISRQGEEDWMFICEMIPGKSWEDCKFKWLSMSRVNLHKNPWTPSEDLALTNILCS